MAADIQKLDGIDRKTLDMIEKWLSEDGVRIGNLWDMIVYAMMKRPNKAEGDSENEDGILICGKCGTAKQKPVYVEAFQGTVRTSHPCVCEAQAIIAREEERLNNEFSEATERCYGELQLIKRGKGATFEKDNLSNAKESIECLKFAGAVIEQYKKHEALSESRVYQKISGEEYESAVEEIYENSGGLLLYGNIGAGKSYLAECVKNKALENRVSAVMTNIQMLTAAMGQYKERKVDVLYKVSNVGLLILDDFGTERNTDAIQEHTLEIVETRINAKRPLVITTNLTLEELKHPVREEKMSHREYVNKCRTYDRLLSMCRTHLNFSGASQRRK